MITTIILSVFIALVALGVLMTIGSIGKPRKPTTPGVAVALVVWSAIQISGLVYVMVNR